MIAWREAHKVPAMQGISIDLLVDIITAWHFAIKINESYGNVWITVYHRRPKRMLAIGCSQRRITRFI